MASIDMGDFVDSLAIGKAGPTAVDALAFVSRFFRIERASLLGQLHEIVTKYPVSGLGFGKVNGKPVLAVRRSDFAPGGRAAIVFFVSENTDLVANVNARIRTRELQTPRTIREFLPFWGEYRPRALRWRGGTATADEALEEIRKTLEALS